MKRRAKRRTKRQMEKWKRTEQLAITFEWSVENSRESFMILIMSEEKFSLDASKRARLRTREIHWDTQRDSNLSIDRDSQQFWHLPLSACASVAAVDLVERPGTWPSTLPPPLSLPSWSPPCSWPLRFCSAIRSSSLIPSLVGSLCELVQNASQVRSTVFAGRTERTSN